MGIRLIWHRVSPVQTIKFNIILFFLISYCLWIFVFGIQRYLIVLELLSGLLLYLFMEIVFDFPKYRALMFGLLAIMLVATTIPPDWGRTSWNSTWFDIKVPGELTANNEMFIMLSGEPLSYLIPSFPPDARFIRIEGNFVPSPQTLLAKQIQQTIENQEGIIYSLSVLDPTDQEVKLLTSYGLARARVDCIRFSSKIHPAIVVCPLSRISAEFEPKQ